MVLLPDVKKVIEAMQNSPTAAYLIGCSEHEKIMLAAVLKCIRKNGLETIKWGEVNPGQHFGQHFNISFNFLARAAAFDLFKASSQRRRLNKNANPSGY
jgi:hypothetical protein